MVEAVLPLVANHMAPNSLYQWQAGRPAIRRLAARVGRLDRLVSVVRADMDGRPPRPQGDYAATDWLLAEAKAMAIQDRKPEPLVLGRDVLKLGFDPGPRVGELVRACYEAQLDGVFETAEAGREYLRSLVTG